ncbi:hypothetical protein EOD39_10827 [Acipenser ruthenus]|uniref:Uncharacterized protein n=1 Tax=Acipenser ruthenus TaxID=7906 RepID=A0A444TX42_ACIRT|nr:hypothetical protein EOD39_10827 [Acipenser ruthenus]
MDATQFTAMMVLLHQTLMVAMQGGAGAAGPDWRLWQPTKHNGKGQAAARPLSLMAMMEYPMLKAAILTRVGATPEGFWKKFREEVFADTEHPQAVAHCLPRLETMAAN